MKQVNGYDVYYIKCSSCHEEFKGRFWYPSFGSGDGVYCQDCSNLKIYFDGYKGPRFCECGGKWNSFNLLCPNCNNIIADSEKQLSLQFYEIPSKDSKGPTQIELDEWYYARLNEGFFSSEEKSLFVQLARVLIFDDSKKKWVYNNLFEV